MSRVEVKAALRALQSNPGFRQYVNTLERAMDDIMVRIILPENRDERDNLCAEAYVYYEILKDIKNNTGQ